METILGIVRHGLTFAAGYLVSKGYIDAAATETIVGAIMTLATVAWSAAAKSDKFPKIK